MIETGLLCVGDQLEGLSSVRKLLSPEEFSEAAFETIPDENAVIRRTLRMWSSSKDLHLILTIGGSGYDTLTHPKVAALCIEASAMIETAIHAREVTAHLAILHRYSHLVTRYPADGLLAIDGEGRILNLTPAAAHLLRCSRASGGANCRRTHASAIR